MPETTNTEMMTSAQHAEHQLELAVKELGWTRTLELMDLFARVQRDAVQTLDLGVPLADSLEALAQNLRSTRSAHVSQMRSLRRMDAEDFAMRRLFGREE